MLGGVDLGGLLKPLGDSLRDDAQGLIVVPFVDLQGNPWVRGQLDQFGTRCGTEVQRALVGDEVDREDVDVAPGGQGEPTDLSGAQQLPAGLCGQRLDCLVIG